MTAAEMRVALHAGARDGVKRDRHGRLAQTSGKHRDAADLSLVVGAPDKGLHATHRAADDGMELGDTEVTDQQALSADDVAKGDFREVTAVRLARARVGRERAGRTAAATDTIHADDEEAIGVDGLAWPDEAIPPARLAVLGRIASGHMMVSAQGVGDQDRVRLVRQQSSVGLIAERQGR